MSDSTTPQDDAAMSPASAGSLDRAKKMSAMKPSAYLAMPSGYDFGVFMTQHEADDWLSRKDTNWKRIAPLYVWFDWEEMRMARERMAVKEGHMYQAEISALREEVEMLRLTDAERTAIQRLIEDYEGDGEPASAGVAATLRGLLSRLAPLSGTGQSPDSDK